MKLQYQPPILSPDRIPSVPSKESVREEPANFQYTVIGLLFPPAGLGIWLAYLLCKPSTSYRRAESALLGAGVGLLLALAWDLVLCI